MQKKLLIAQMGNESAISKAQKKWRVYESTQKVANGLYRWQFNLEIYAPNLQFMQNRNTCVKINHK